MTVKLVVRAGQRLPTTGVQRQHQRFESVAHERTVGHNAHDRAHVRQQHQEAREHDHRARRDRA